MAEIYRTMAFLPLAPASGRRHDGVMPTEIAVLVFDKLAVQDMVGPYEVMRNVPDWKVETVAKKTGEVRAEGGLTLLADRALEDVDSADIVLVPGGLGNRPL